MLTIVKLLYKKKKIEYEFKIDKTLYIVLNQGSWCIA